MDCNFKQEKKTWSKKIYQIQEYDGLKDMWVNIEREYSSLDTVISFYENNTDEFSDDPRRNTPVYRIIEKKIISKPLLTNTRQLEWQKSHINKLRKEGKI